jgi:hypothetical protein
MQQVYTVWQQRLNSVTFPSSKNYLTGSEHLLNTQRDSGGMINILTGHTIVHFEKIVYMTMGLIRND